jgi:3-oxoacyl-[acyl-carrier protein] reductase
MKEKRFQMELDLDGKRVLITGSSRGIGMAIARAFLAEGASVFLTSRNQADLDRLGAVLSKTFAVASIFSSVCDFRDIRHIEELKKRIITVWNGLDILILNVGSGKSVSDPIPSKANFDDVLHLNFGTAVDATREFYPLIKESSGNLLFVASIAGLEAIGAPVDYAAAKSALIAFSKNLARKAAIDGVRVNCVAPGNIYFKDGSWDEKLASDPEGIKKLIATTVPMQRFGSPEEIAAAAVFLASERSSFTTGSCLTVDGGQTACIF